MSELGKRLGKMLKSNLNALMEFAGEGPEREALNDLSDEELLRELERRRAERIRKEEDRVEREAAENAAREREAARKAATAAQGGQDAQASRARTPKEESDARAAAKADDDARAWVDRERAKRAAAAAVAAARGASSRPSSRSAPVRGQDVKLAQAYAALECTYGSDFATVKSQYRVLLRKYHPDLHQNAPEKQKVATELTRKLAQAYNDLEKALAKK